MIGSRRVAYFGLAGTLLVPLAILISFFANPDWIVPLGAAFCAFACVRVGAILVPSFATNSIRWRGSTYLGSQNPSLFWSLNSLSIVALVAYASLGAFMISMALQ